MCIGSDYKLSTYELHPNTKILLGIKNNDRLTNIKLKGITQLSRYAFSNCTNLKTVTFSKDIKSIDESAFYNCSKLTDIYYEGSEEDWNNIFIDKNNNILSSITIHYNYVPEESEE